MKTTKPTAGVGDLSPVRVKREGGDSERMNEDEPGWSEPDAVVKTEDMGVPCKAELTEVSGASMFFCVPMYRVFRVGRT